MLHILNQWGITCQLHLNKTGKNLKKKKKKPKSSPWSSVDLLASLWKPESLGWGLSLNLSNPDSCPRCQSEIFLSSQCGEAQSYRIWPHVPPLTSSPSPLHAMGLLAGSCTGQVHTPLPVCPRLSHRGWKSLFKHHLRRAPLPNHPLYASLSSSLSSLLAWFSYIGTGTTQYVYWFF